MLLIRVIVMLFVVFCGSVQASETKSTSGIHSGRILADTYISSEEISAAKGKYSLHIKGFGKVVIHSARSSTVRKPKSEIKSCLIDKHALQSEILRAFKNLGGRDSNAETTKEIKMKGVMQGGQMVCTSGGSNCTVIVSIPDCRYDPDSAELPCS